MAANPKKLDLTGVNNSLTNEIVGVILLAVGLLFALCLLTYNSADPSLNTASREPIQNYVGIVGANISTILLQTFGLAAYVLPLLIVLAAWQAFWSESLYVPLVRVVGFAVFLITVAALLPLFGFGLFFDGSVPAGGFVGALIALFLASGLGTIGSIILLLAIAAAAFLLVTNVSYAPLVIQLKIWYDAALERLQMWRDSEREQARLRLENRRSVRADAPNDFTQSLKETKLRQEQRAKLPENSTATPALSQTAAEYLTNAAHSVTATVKNFLERIKHPPNFTADEIVPKQSGEIASANAAAASIEIKPRVEREQPLNKIVKAMPADDLDFADAAEADSFDSEIPIQPLKSGDAFEPEEIEENDVDFDNPPIEIRNPKPNVPRVFIPYASYELPQSFFLNAAPARIQHADDELIDIAKTLETKCQEFKAAGKVVNICPGPVVTTYEYKLNTGVQFKAIANLVDDLCLGLQAESVRIDRIPGKAFVGVEVPNPRRETIFLREVLESRSFGESKSLLTIALGKTVDGLNYVADLAKMPHLLIAGATGAGKSVGVNSLIVSILYKARPDEVKFIMVDPKQVELNLYADIPHLATPIITEPKRAAAALKWAVAEMERRYKQLSGWFVRNIEGYNAEVHRRNFVEEFDETGASWKPLPYLVIIIDEFADLMIVARNEVEESIMRLVAKARAVGIHLILATQRPSVDVVTGVIKANFPCRIAFRVSSGIDSKTIINTIGAENLLGRGDMLFLPPGANKLLRVHGAFVEESEIHKIVEHVKEQGAPEYDTTITQTEEEADSAGFDESENDELFPEALKICVEMKRASTSVLQRRLSIGYGRAAKIIDAMERAGYVGQSDGASKPRPVLDKAYERIADWNEMGS